MAKAHTIYFKMNSISLYHANLAFGRSPHNTGFLTVILPGFPGYALYPSAQGGLRPREQRGYRYRFSSGYHYYRILVSQINY